MTKTYQETIEYLIMEYRTSGLIDSIIDSDEDEESFSDDLGESLVDSVSFIYVVDSDQVKEDMRSFYQTWDSSPERPWNTK